MKKQHRYKSGSIAQSPVRGKRRLPGKMRHSFVHRSDFKSLVQESKEMVQKELMRLRNFNLSDEGIVDIKGNPNMVNCALSLPEWLLVKPSLLQLFWSLQKSIFSLVGLECS